MISIVVISKDEPFLGETLHSIEAQRADVAGQVEVEILVVDASQGRQDCIRRSHPEVRWIDFSPHSPVSVSIPHQRNLGVDRAAGNVIVFTDAGCAPQAGWLRRLALLLGEESLVAGAVRSARRNFRLYDSVKHDAAYVDECSTINLAVRREVFSTLGGFDESFSYGSDVDFSWRARDSGYRIRFAPDATVVADWGDWRRQLRRSYLYGRARVQLYRKHPVRARQILRRDPMVVVWPVFILGLPLALRHPEYLLLLAIPAWRNRDVGSVRVIIDHLCFGCGVLAGLARP